jgi:hypothetical protein
VDKEQCSNCKFFETLEEYEKRTGKTYPTIKADKAKDGFCHKEPKLEPVDNTNWCFYHKEKK